MSRGVTLKSLNDRAPKVIQDLLNSIDVGIGASTAHDILPEIWAARVAAIHRAKEWIAAVKKRSSK